MSWFISRSVAATSTVNTDVGGAVANTAIVPVSDAGFSVTGFFGDGGSSHVVVDAIGYITGDSAAASQAGRFVAVTPGRAFDSRTEGGPLLDADVVVVGAADAPGSSVPSDASGVVWNTTIVAAQRPGFARTWGADSNEPPTSSLNWSVAGETRAAAVIGAVDGARARFRIDDGPADAGPLADLVVDVFGYFS